MATICSNPLDFQFKVLQKPDFLRNADLLELKKCRNCPFKAMCYLDLLRHYSVKGINGCKGFECETCKTFCSSMTGLQRHIYNRHSARDKDKQMKCKFCDYKSKNAGNLKRHAWFRHLNDAEKKQSGFKCDLCDFISLTKSKVRDHNVKKHSTGGQPWLKCERCKYKTQVKAELKAHVEKMHRQTKDMKFTCEHCQKGFKRKYQCQQHIQKEHSITKEIPIAKVPSKT